jgi:hypothetical protein
MSKQIDPANDYALAKYLDERVVAIFAMVANTRGDLPDLTNINRSYVLMVNELKQIYKRNDKLGDIRDNICWRTFGSIDAMDPYLLYEYSDDYRNHGNDHISKVNELCIVSGKEEQSNLTLELQNIIDGARISVGQFIANQIIPKYTFEMTGNGTLLVNGVTGIMKVTKVQASSTTDMILTQAKDQPGILFVPEVKAFSKKRGLRTFLAEVGFTGAIEKLFFPVMDNKNGLMFRPTVTRAEAEKEMIDLTKLDTDLKALGARYIPTFDYPT